MASAREIQTRNNRAKRFLQTCLKAWQVQSIDDLPEAAGVDFLKLDVQGAEAEIVEASIVEMTQKVRRVHIGTHGHDLEERIRATFKQAGWRCCNDFPCQSTVVTNYGEINFGDGVQSWINLNIR